MYIHTYMAINSLHFSLWHTLLYSYVKMNWFSIAKTQSNYQSVRPTIKHAARLMELSPAIWVFVLQCVMLLFILCPDRFPNGKEDNVCTVSTSSCNSCITSLILSFNTGKWSKSGWIKSRLSAIRDQNNYIRLTVPLWNGRKFSFTKLLEKHGK